MDDPQLYEDWRFTAVSHLRISSHHRDIDKARYPDIGMRGQVVREKLHGRTAQGTWVQLEKTPAAFGQRKLPSLTDLRHLMDYVVYRVTRSNVGPWGLSQLTERRPMYLSPDLAVPTSLAPPVAESLALALRRISAADDVTAVSRIWRAGSAPPGQADPANELGQALTGRAGRGLFGNSKVWVTETPSRRLPRSWVSSVSSRPGGVVGGSGVVMTGTDANGRRAGPRPGVRAGRARLGRGEPGQHRAGAARRVHHRRAHRG